MRPSGARIFDFNAERSALVAEVERRVMQSVASIGGTGGLEYLLNDAVFHEINRYEGRKTRRGRRSLARWVSVRRQLSGRDAEWIERQVWRLVHYHTEDIAGNFNPRVYGFASRVLPLILSGILNAGSVDRRLQMFRSLADRARVEGDVEHIRALSTRSTLILVPTHSSNLDSLVVGGMLSILGLSPMTYGAGKNLFSNPLFTFFMRNLGAYRVDRRLGFDLYKEVLKTYSQVLLERGFHSLFFAGGTRSRSNVLESHLKLGLLGTAFPAQVERLRAGVPNPAIVVVPATINYALVLEAETLIDDHLKREGQQRFIISDDESSRANRVLSFLFHLLRIDNTLHLRFGTPMDLLGNPVDPDGVSRDPRGRRVDLASYFKIGGELAVDQERDREYTRQLGGYIASSFRRNTIVLPTHLVARALFRRVRFRFQDEDIYAFLRRDGTLSVARDQLLRDCADLRDGLRSLASEGQIVIGEAANEEDMGAVLSRAVDTFRIYHSRPVIRMQGDRIVAGDLRLLLFYQNRLEGYRIEERIPEMDSGAVQVGAPGPEEDAVLLGRVPRRLRKIAASDDAQVPLTPERSGGESGR